MRLAPSADSPIGSATGPAQQWRMRFLADWLSASAPLRRARASGLLHGAAAALASGMLAGLYLRGLAFEYRAGWESTFLGPQAVRALLGSVLGPASALSGLPLPDVAALAKLRFSIGQGEIANQWIHLIGITLLLFAIVPRLTCAIVAWRNASRLRDDFPIDCQDPTLSEAVRRMRGQGASIRVLPCGWRASHSALAALEKSLVAEFGSDATVTTAPTLAPEQADDPQNLPPLLDADRVVVLFTLSVTPEPETHGAFLRVVARHMGAGATLAAWIDESAFASRFAGQPRRLEERRAAWRSMLKAQAVPERFVQLEQPT